MKTELGANEQITKDGRANAQRGLEAVGGHLYLTDHRLIFESHAFNIQRGTIILDLADIVAVEPSWARLLGFIPLVPNSIKVVLRSGRDYRFVVSDKSQWIADISAALEKKPGG